jgi:voltage-gated potassium channel
MTAITLTTVGYTEAIDLSHGAGGRIFTVFLLFFGVGAVLYLFSALTAFLVEGHVQKILWRRRMERNIQRMSGHTVVCGGGATGRYIVQELFQTGRDFVLVEQDEEKLPGMVTWLESEFPVVVGDATDDDTLRAAGIERADGLVACLSNDKDNLILTVSARILRPELRIVCRCIDQQVEEKIRKAGADAVVSPNRIGGLRMISEMIRPVAVSYLDLMLRDHRANVRVEATRIGSDSLLAGETVGDVRERRIDGLVILALQEGDQSWIFAPSDDLAMQAGASLIFMGSPDARRELEELAQTAI